MLSSGLDFWPAVEGAPSVIEPIKFGVRHNFCRQSMGFLACEPESGMRPCAFCAISASCARRFRTYRPTSIERSAREQEKNSMRSSKPATSGAGAVRALAGDLPVELLASSVRPLLTEPSIPADWLLGGTGCAGATAAVTAGPEKKNSGVRRSMSSSDSVRESRMAVRRGDVGGQLSSFKSTVTGRDRPRAPCVASPRSGPQPRPKAQRCSRKWRARS
mmetsp:Transcript_39282/g.69070  ORF Transcript_39282/g.69070 Transcript_39282/m.69070 type:complete len:218 (-) Transcript_39282:561-1214(-)